MQDRSGPHYGGPERGSDRLVTKTDAEHGYLACQLLDHRDAYAGLSRGAWPRRDDNSFKVAQPRFDLVNSDLVVTNDFHLYSKFGDELVQVVGKRVVVIYEQNHETASAISIDSASSMARTSARIL